MVRKLNQLEAEEAAAQAERDAAASASAGLEGEHSSGS